MRARILISLLLTLAALAIPHRAGAARLKDLVDVQGFRSNALVGLGVVVGLAGTGDDPGSFVAKRPLATILKNLGSSVDPSDVRARNVAMVLVTAELVPFARSGMSLEVTVSSIGTAKSLQGGTLIATALKGLDRETYAVAQGQLLVGGYEVRAQSGSLERKNHTTVGRIPDGAIVEREAPSKLPEGEVVLMLKAPDFTTAARIKGAVEQALGAGAVSIRDPGAVVVKVDSKEETFDLIARLEALEATPDAPARVVIDERSGTIVVGGSVTVAPVAIAYGALKVRISERYDVSQPNPFARGQTAVVPGSEIQVDDGPGKLQTVEGSATVGEIAAALNSLGVRPRDLVAIFQALKAAGALTAEIRVL
ncbi:MAG: flagellar basal body P-ring protein FlgI [Deltaproteobacteria bacterium]|nr:flagellar basal body P-ring protein FlgI [Deltaproteobacteria bacterium]